MWQVFVELWTGEMCLALWCVCVCKQCTQCARYIAIDMRMHMAMLFCGTLCFYMLLVFWCIVNSTLNWANESFKLSWCNDAERVNILWKFYQNIYNSTLCGFFWSWHLSFPFEHMPLCLLLLSHCCFSFHSPACLSFSSSSSPFHIYLWVFFFVK